MAKYIIHTVTKYPTLGNVRATYTVPAKNAPHAVNHINALLRTRKSPEKIVKVEKPKSD